MNTNRGSYMLGAALGSALVLTLCVKAHAADIYEAPPAQVVEAPPPPPPSTEASTSRAISARPTRTSGASGPKATTPTTPSRCSTTTSRAPCCTASASAGSIATGCASISRVSIVATPSLSVRTGISSSAAARTSTRPISRAGWVSPTPTSISDAGAGSRRTSARASVSPRSRSNGLEDINTPQGEHVLRRRPHHHELRLGAVRWHELRHLSVAQPGSLLPLRQPRHRQERRSHRLRRLELLQRSLHQGHHVERPAAGLPLQAPARGSALRREVRPLPAAQAAGGTNKLLPGAPHFRGRPAALIGPDPSSGPPPSSQVAFLVRLRVRQAHSARRASSRRGLFVLPSLEAAGRIRLETWGEASASLAVD